jgi:DnaJ-class molecular chaperone
MTQEITAFSLDEARRLAAQWGAKADELSKKTSGWHGTSNKAKAKAFIQSADELEAILPATPCPHCDGTGQRVGEHNGFATWYEPCVECDGKGKAK